MNQHFPSACEIDTAKRELGAFLYVVSELYGPEEGELSAQDWLDELALLNCFPNPAPRDWRLVTIAAATRLAKRVSQQAHGKPIAS
jgi:hypothetical protein